MRHLLKTFRKNHGFSLVELMVVVAIIGILASIALPKFQAFQAKAKQAEAKTNLAGIYTYQISYNGEYGSFFKTINTAQIFGGAALRYTYTIPAAAANTFSAKASAAAGVLGACQTAVDNWTINENRVLSNTTRGLAPCGM